MADCVCPCHDGFVSEYDGCEKDRFCCQFGARIRRGPLDSDVKIYYFETPRQAGKTELMRRLREKRLPDD